MMQIVPRRRATPARETRRRQAGGSRAHRGLVRGAGAPDARTGAVETGRLATAGMMPDEFGPGSPRTGFHDLPPMADDAPIRDELLRRWAHVLLAQHGDGAALYVQERRRARAAQGDCIGVEEWSDVGAIICELTGIDGLPGDESYLTIASYSWTPDSRAGVEEDDEPSPPWREWAFWVILCALAAGGLMLLLMARSIWTAL